MNTERATFAELIERELGYRRPGVEHYDHDIQILLSQMYYRLLDIPKWKVWKIIPMVAKITEVEQYHASQCPCKLDPT